MWEWPKTTRSAAGNRRRSRAARPEAGPESCTIARRTPARSASRVSGAPQAATSGASLLPSTTRTGAYAASSSSTPAVHTSPACRTRSALRRWRATRGGHERQRRGACVSASTTTLTPLILPAPGRGDRVPGLLLRELTEVEPGALIIGAVGREAVRRAPGLGCRAARRGHPAGRRPQVGDSPHRHGGGPGVPAGQAHRGRGAHHLPAVGDPSRGEAPAEHRAVEVARPARVRHLEGDVGKITIVSRGGGAHGAGAAGWAAPGGPASGGPASGGPAFGGGARAASCARRRGLVYGEPGALVVHAVGAQAVRPRDRVAGLAAGRPYPRHRLGGVLHDVGAEQRGPGLTAPQALWRGGAGHLPAAGTA